MDNELRIGMKFLEVKTGIVWELANTAYGFSTFGESLCFKAVHVNTDEDNVWRSIWSTMPKTMFERKIKSGELKQINNRKNNYY